MRRLLRVALAIPITIGASLLLLAGAGTRLFGRGDTLLALGMHALRLAGTWPGDPDDSN